MNYSIMALNILLFLLLAVSAVFFMKFVNSREQVQSLANKFYQKIVRGDISKEADLENIRQTVGEIQKKTFYERTNDLLYYSGLRFRFYWFTPTVFVICMVLLFTVGIMIGLLGSHSLIMALLCGIMLPFTFYFILYALITYNHVEVENELVLLMNMVEDFSSANDNIISIFEKASVYLGRHLRSAIDSCVSYANTTGDTSRALRKLQDHVEHPQFKRFIASIELASRGSCEYRHVVEDFRERTENSLTASKRLDAIYKNCRAQVIAMLLVGIFVIYMSLGLVTDYGGFWQVINFNIAGQLILMAIIVIYLVSAWFVLFRLNRQNK